MRKALVMGALAAIIGAASPAAAQTASLDGKWVVTAGGGVTIPVGDIADVLKTGWNASVFIGYQPNNTRMSIGLEGRYYHATNKISEQVSGDDFSDILTILARANFMLGDAAYILVGVGEFRNEFDELVGDRVIKNTHAAADIAAGLGINFGKHFFIEGRVNHAFTRDGSTTLIPITAGIRF